MAETESQAYRRYDRLEAEAEGHERVACGYLIRHRNAPDMAWIDLAIRHAEQAEQNRQQMTTILDTYS